MDPFLQDDTAEPRAADGAPGAADPDAAAPASSGDDQQDAERADRPGSDEANDDDGSLEKDPELVAFGANIRELRLKAKLTQEALAKRSDLHWTYISQVERGVRNTSYTSLRKLAHGLGVAPGRVMPDRP
jgi:ribosome-binding protein aMBF1 (putative translation factor)